MDRASLASDPAVVGSGLGVLDLSRPVRHSGEPDRGQSGRSDPLGDALYTQDSRDSRNSRDSRSVDDFRDEHRPLTRARSRALRNRQFNTDRPLIIPLEPDIVVLEADQESDRGQVGAPINP